MKTARVIRLVLTLALIGGAYTETGVWTALTLLLLATAVELQNIVWREITE